MGPLFAHAESFSGWFSGFAFPSPIPMVMGRMFFIGIEFGRLRMRYTYLRFQKLSKICVGINPDSLINAATEVLGYISVIERACLLINF